MRCDQISEKHRMQYLKNIGMKVISDDKNEVERRRYLKKTKLFYLPILSRVVIANVAIDRLESETKPSISSWHLDTLIDENGIEKHK